MAFSARVVVILKLLIVPYWLLGGEVSFIATTTKNKVAIGEQFQVTFTLNTNGTNFKAPSFDDFQFLGGPSQSSSMQIINGNFSQSISFTYYLAGKNPGIFTISPASIMVNGKKIESNTLKIEVTKDQVAQSSPQSRQQQNRWGFNQNGITTITEKELADNVFLKAVASKTSALVGEQVLVTYKLYRRIDVVQYQVKEIPKYNGFWKEELKVDNQTYYESIDGIQYAVTDLKKIILIPQRTGQLQVDPLDIDVLVRLRARRSNSFFDDFFGFSSFQNYNLSLKSKALTITVKDLPGNPPPDFSGLVGSLSMSSKLSKQEAKTDESITFKITISGKGNLKLVDPPKLDLPEELEVYDPKVSDNLTVTSQGISGSKTFEYLIIPRSGGDFKINPVKLSYFDLQTNQFKTLSSEAFSLKVKGGIPSNSIASGPLISRKEDVKLKGNDIAYIKTNTELKSTNNYFFGSLLFNLSCLLIVALGSGLVIYQNRLDAQKSDVGAFRRSRALKNAQARLKQTKSITQNDLFYQQLASGIYQYIGDKFNVGLAQATVDLVKEKLSESPEKLSVTQDLKHIIETCEMARFAPVQNAVEREQLLNKAESTLLKLEELIG